ncbi:MAG: SDR family NAD(P)-dependent oxidoreductase, partial [Verrucomicrobiota bacterium]
EEPFLSDYQVKGQKMLSGAAYLEMAREAVERSTKQPVTHFKNVEWLAPISINGRPQPVQVRLFKNGQGINYQISSNGSASQAVIHGCGTVSAGALPSLPRYEVSALQRGLPQQATGETIYELFTQSGLHYGSRFRGIKKLYYSQAAVLGQLHVSREPGYTLQPGMVDSAIQTCIGFHLLNTQHSPPPQLPFKVKEVAVYGAVGEVHWSYVRKSPANHEDGRGCSYDIELLTEAGKVLLQLKDCTLLAIEELRDDQRHLDAVDSQLHYYTLDWGLEAAVEAAPVSGSAHTVILGGGSEALARKLAKMLGQEAVALHEGDEIANYLKVQELVQAKVEQKERAALTLVYRNTNVRNYGFLSGLFKAMALENPRLTGKTVGVEHLSLKEIASLQSIILTEQRDTAKEVRYVADGRREVRHLRALSEALDDHTVLPVKAGGVYLITGGGGGLGKIFAEYLSATKEVRLILAGRSLECKLSDVELERLGAVYYPCDVSHERSVKKLIDRILGEYGSLDGIIHSAGVLGDNFLHKKTAAEARQVLSAKIMGALHLDRATRGVELDFMVYNSSIAGVAGNVGQADYASANAWLDQYAHYRNQHQVAGKRSGHTVSINWPYWEEGGMHLDAAYLEMLGAQTGMQPLGRSEGIEALKVALRTRYDQLIVVSGDPDRLQSAFVGTVFSGKRSATDEQDVREGLLTLFSKVFGFKEPEALLSHSLEELGADSILLMQLRDALEKQFGLPLHVSELTAIQDVEGLLTYLEGELGSDEPAIQSAASGPQLITFGSVSSVSEDLAVAAVPKLANTVFVLAPPRSGSTLLRVMLAGHSKIFAPPELYLLDHPSMGRRSSDLGAGGSFLNEGLIHALSVLWGDAVEVVREKVRTWEREDVSIASVYAELHKKLEGAFLVDKTPMYSMQYETLLKAEALFEDPLYIHLHRHPLASMGSFVNNRFHKMRGASTLSPWKLAEESWTRSHGHIRQFLQTIPEDRKLDVAYEALVRHPQGMMERVCELLKIDFEGSMCSPYDESREKMTGGLHAVSKMIGDPNFLKHTTIDPSLAEGWRRYADRWDGLDQKTRELAASFNYDLSEEKGEPVATSQKATQWTLKSRFAELEVLQEGGKGVPVIWFAPMFGSIDGYRKLAGELKGQIPSYAVQAVHAGVKGGAMDLTTIHAQAAYFSEQIMAWKDGLFEDAAQPIRLGGFSYGGIVAYATMVELQKREVLVDHITILDAVCPDGKFHKTLFGGLDPRSSLLAIGFDVLFFTHQIVCTPEEEASLYQLEEVSDVIEALVELGLQKGLKGSKGAYIAWMKNTHEVVQKNQAALSGFSISKPARPAETTCLFIRRNRQEAFYELSGEPLTEMDKQRQQINEAYSTLDPVRSWGTLFPNFRSVIGPAKGHYDLLTDEASVGLIASELIQLNNGKDEG